MTGNVLTVFGRSVVRPPPIWLMRQAGRYLPEYRALREKAGSFWAMCMTPKLAAEVTLQPMRRFSFDAAIIFSDIFVVTAAMGVDVAYEDGFGPRVAVLTSANELPGDARRWRETVDPVYETIGLVRKELSPQTALIGFVGGPWTLATYLAQGHGSEDQRAAKLWAYRDPDGFTVLIDRLAEAVAEHLSGQIEAGADVVQIFESWSQGLTSRAFERWVIEPTTKIVARLRTKHPKARVIGFPRATSLEGYRLYADRTGVDAISIDTATPIAWAARTLGPKCVLQGNLDPIVLLAGGKALEDSVEEILGATATTPFLFNLGHGILPETPIAHVEQLIKRVRGG
jgi:uroporphyrinogen decarboxylase